MAVVSSPVRSPVRSTVYAPTSGKYGATRQFLPPFHVLVVAGQSNGFAAGPTSIPAEVSSLGGGVKIWDGSALQPYVAGVASSPDGVSLVNKWGAEAYYAKRWLAQNSTGSLVIVKRPRDATKIATWQSGQTNFDTLTGWVTSAKSALSEAPSSTSVLWLQGESDSIVDQPLADAYQASLTSFLASARSAWGDANTPIAIMRVYRANLAFGSTVRAAQKAVAVADAKSYLINTDDQTLVDTYHYDATGVIAIGDRMFTAIRDGVGFEYEATTSLVPMTAAAAPAGYAASASSNFNATFVGWKAFDQSSSISTGRWATTVPAPGNAATIELQTPTAIKTGAYSWRIYNGAGSAATDAGPGAIVLEGSNDGVTWTPILTSSSILPWANDETKLFEIPVANRGTFSRHRWSVSGSVSGGYTSLEITLLLAA